MDNYVDVLFEDRILSLVEICAPLRVTVSVKRVKDKFYIHFDGTAAYKNPDDWDKYWVSFKYYITHLLDSAHFDSSKLKIKKPAYAVAMIGSLFDLLARDYSND